MRKLLTLLSLTLIAMTSAADVTYTNGFGDDDSYEPATLVNGYYEIDNGGKLFWFANYVNNNHRSVSAKLTADVDLENREWPIICPTSSAFTGEFDGQGHSIANLNVNSNADFVAFIGYHSSTSKYIKNFSISGTLTYTGNKKDNRISGIVAQSTGSKIQDVICKVNINTPGADGSRNLRVAGIVAWAEANTTINRCTYSGIINGYLNPSQMAGIIGLVNANDVTVTNCLYIGTINSENTSSSYVGGILGYINPGQRTGFVCENNLSVGYFNVATTTYAGVLAGQRNGTGNASFSNNYVLLTHGLTAAQGSGTTTNAISITDETILTDGTLVDQLDIDNWTQGTNNPIPYHSHDHAYNNGFCIMDDCVNPYEKAELLNSYYLIDNGGKLFWLAQQVNKGNTAYNAKLTADIDLENRLWTPIGRAISYSANEPNNPAEAFTGEFDGQGYSIRNLNINADASERGVAFIDYHYGTKDIMNFTITGNIISHATGAQQTDVAGVVAYNNGANKIQDIVCAINIESPEATSTVRIVGLVARAGNGTTINRCTYSGTVNGYGTGNQVSGILGCATVSSEIKLINCLFSGTLKSANSNAYIGGIWGYQNTSGKSTVTNNLSIGSYELASASGKYTGALIGWQRYALASSGDNYYVLNTVQTAKTIGSGSGLNCTAITTLSVLSDGTTLAALGTNNWAQDPVAGHPVPKPFTCTESNDGAAATVTGTVCAYNFNVFKNAVKDYATVDMSGAAITSNIANEDVESLLTNNNLVYLPSSTELTGGKNIVKDDICDELELTDGQPFVPTSAFEASAASYTRNIANAWGTICLPYEVESNDDVTYYTTGTINDDVLTLTSAGVVPAGTPAIFKAAGSSLTADGSNVSVQSAVQSETITNDDITLIGSFTKQTILATDVPNAFYISGGKFWHATGTLTVNPFRAYFTTNSASPSNGFSITVDDDNVTAIQALTGESDVTVTAIYTADGKQIGELQNGLNIVKLSNGKTKKIMIK